MTLVKDGKVTSFPTGEEREYSEGFCQAYAKGLNQALSNRGDKSFIEIFSGPNAPLSRAVALEWEKKDHRNACPPSSEGVHVELAEITTPVKYHETSKEPESFPRSIDEISGTDTTMVVNEPEVNQYRMAAVQAAKQPSYGKRMQLIQDGLESPEKHMAEAKKLEHPFDSLSTLKEDHRKAVEQLASNPRELVARRFEALDRLKSWAIDLESKQKAANRGASWTAQQLGLKPRTELMKRLQDVLNIEDKSVPEACLKGLRITGPASESNFFEPFEVPPSMSWTEFHRDKQTRSQSMIERVEFMAKKGSPELARAIWEKTMKEVKKGTMGPPMSLEEVRKKYRDDFQVTPSFGLEQGTNDQGQPKYRRIDDRIASGVNQFSKRMQKVPMAMIDYVGVMLRAVAQRCNSVYMGTEDMQGAYRQVPLHCMDVKYAIAAVYDPDSKQVKLFEMYGQPFGAGHAVPNFCRVSEWVSRMLQRFFHMHVDHFFDDFFIIEPEDTIISALVVMKEGFKLLGFTLDPDKSQQQTNTCPILGVIFSSSVLASERKLLIKAKPTRVSNLITQIDKILEHNELSPAQAGSIVGKFGFLCSTLFGKVGRCCTAALRHRQYSITPARKLTPQIISSLQLMKRFLVESPTRELKLHHQRPVIVYTDASDVPGRTPQRLVGAVLYDPIDGALLYIHHGQSPPFWSTPGYQKGHIWGNLRS